MTTVEASNVKPAPMAILQRGGIATVIAVVINVALFYLGSLFTFPETAVVPGRGPVTIAPVFGLTLIAGVLATVGYIVLTRFLNLTLARRIELGVALLGVLVMFYNPFTIENVDAAQIVILEIMHLVAAWPALAVARG